MPSSQAPRNTVLLGRGRRCGPGEMIEQYGRGSDAEEHVEERVADGGRALSSPQLVDESAHLLVAWPGQAEPVGEGVDAPGRLGDRDPPDVVARHGRDQSRVNSGSAADHEITVPSASRPLCAEIVKIPRTVSTVK
jgi:hypothetical protein